MNDGSGAFWHGKRVLLTGHTGFKGGWLALWLHKLGAQVTGVALPPATDRPSLFQAAAIAGVADSHFCDIRDAQALAAIVRRARPEIVLHLAAQPLVRASYREPLLTFETNVMGTANLLDGLRGLQDVRVALSITTDKVYRNEEWPHPYRESDALGGHDPYSASKAAAELVSASYRDAFLKQQGVALATARAGNVIGGGDWSDDRLLPDAVRAWQGGRTLEIRSPDSVRPWQHVLEPLAGYLRLAQSLWTRPELAGPYNFGPPSQDTATVHDVVELARAAYGSGDVSYGQSGNGPHEAGLLALDTSRARAVLGVQARWTLAQGVAETMQWYRAWHEGADARALCDAQIAAYGPV
ncbi:CDP-glucose 4,6-dehydratase [Achromobacter pestifer]|uniref:CDP-glucose 4,6-dehydratase n=1 Tax=Achromobacter pestifer TaxID=1353889 RepID=A0A6S6YM88_9BURK|nr:CDP-glucose 4,6-dehydratase [Achromobacter pestifer]CAB3630913.1 CDP-glucose 4,6-dehydratase [Achromobacter pestifer]